MSNRMTNTEAVMLCRFAKACCPQQQVDEFTPDAWWELLNDLTFDACKTALVEVVKRQPFVAPAEIRAEVKRVRDDRMLRGAVLLERARPTDWSFEGERAWERQMRRLIADGEVTSHEDMPQWTEAEVLAMNAPPALTAAAPKPGDWNFDPEDPRTLPARTWMERRPDTDDGPARGDDVKHHADAARAAIRTTPTTEEAS